LTSPVPGGPPPALCGCLDGRDGRRKPPFQNQGEDERDSNHGQDAKSDQPVAIVGRQESVGRQPAGESSNERRNGEAGETENDELQAKRDGGHGKYSFCGLPPSSRSDTILN
jgi:hypothetical protein